MAPHLDNSNYETFRDCFSAALLERVSRGQDHSPKHSRRSKKGSKDLPSGEEAEELADFIDSLSYPKTQEDPRLAAAYAPEALPALIEDLLPSIPPDVTESLEAYAVLPAGTAFEPLLAAAVTAYAVAVTAPPPVWAHTQLAACEICERDWVRLTYHHLVPRQVHAKALKRGWHPSWRLNSVAWLCRACHDFVHAAAGNEALARDFYTVGRLLARDDVRRWAAWVGRVRWKAR